MITEPKVGDRLYILLLDHIHEVQVERIYEKTITVRAISVDDGRPFGLSVHRTRLFHTINLLLNHLRQTAVHYKEEESK